MIWPGSFATTMLHLTFPPRPKNLPRPARKHPPSNQTTTRTCLSQTGASWWFDLAGQLCHNEKLPRPAMLHSTTQWIPVFEKRAMPQKVTTSPHETHVPLWGYGGVSHAGEKFPEILGVARFLSCLLLRKPPVDGGHGARWQSFATTPSTGNRKP